MFALSSNLQAKRFVILIVILTFASLIEVANYYFKFTYQFASLFQDGVIIFILMMSFTIGFYIKDFASLRKQNEKLAFEIGLMEIQIDEQRKYNELIAGKENVLKKQRHDLHHHLIAIRELELMVMPLVKPVSFCQIIICLSELICAGAWICCRTRSRCVSCRH